jgi:two-component system invasion response regulator UvrY
MIKILIADDHTILRDGLKQILAECPDMTVAGEAENGFEALEKVRTHEWDLMVLDMAMPGKSGIDLLKQIKIERPKLPVLVLSMQKENQYAVRALKAGAGGYLCKDSASADLVRAIRKVAAGGMFISPTVAENLAVGLITNTQEPPHTLLSNREYEIFQLIASGLALTAIGERLHLSVKTISTHKTRIMQKMNFTNNSELIRYAVRHQLIDDAGQLAGDDGFSHQ